MSPGVAITRPWLALLSVAIVAAAAFAFPSSAQVEPAKAGASEVRRIDVDIAKAGEPLDRFYNFSVGADYPGTTIRPENLAQLRTATAELGFRYIRFHDIFHDTLGTVRVVNGETVYDWTKQGNLSNRPFFTRVLPATPKPDAEVRIASLAPGQYRVRVRRTGYRANDAHSRYLEMGRPASLSAAQLRELQQLTRDLPETDRRMRVGSDGRVALRVPMRSNDVVLVTLEPAGRSAPR